eukprot:2090925-Amphidinium_carterae.1
MRGVKYFFINQNGFKGALPDNGFQSMSNLTDLDIDTNRFAGALPNEGLRALTGLDLLSARHNCIQGPMCNTFVAVCTRVVPQQQLVGGVDS